MTHQTVDVVIWGGRPEQTSGAEDNLRGLCEGKLCELDLYKCAGDLWTALVLPPTGAPFKLMSQTALFRGSNWRSDMNWR